MNSTERKLLIYFLERYSEDLGNAGCNDFDLSEYMSDEEIEVFVRDAFVRNDPRDGRKDFENLSKRALKRVLPDWRIVDELIDRLKGEAEKS
jgi:hypothetical protein